MDNEMTTLPPPPPAEPNPAPSSRRRGLAVGLAAGLLGGTAVGLVVGVPGLTGAASPSAVVAQTDETPTTETPTTEAPTTDPAPTPPADSEARQADRTARLREQLQPLVDAGTITAEQADAVAAQLVESMPGDRGPGGGWGHRRGGGFPFDGEILETLGIDVATLREQLQDGASLADIAAAQGVDVQALIDALVTEGSERIDEAVAAGRLDETEAATKKAELETRITELVNSSFDGVPGDWGGRGPGHRGEPGEPGPVPESGTSESGTTPDATTPDATTPVTTDN